MGGGVGHNAWSHLQLSSMWLLEAGFPIFPESVFVFKFEVEECDGFQGSFHTQRFLATMVNCLFQEELSNPIFGRVELRGVF